MEPSGVLESSGRLQLKARKIRYCGPISGELWGGGCKEVFGGRCQTQVSVLQWQLRPDAIGEGEREWSKWRQRVVESRIEVSNEVEIPGRDTSGRRRSSSDIQ